MTSAVMAGTSVRAVPHLAGVALTVLERRVLALTASGLTLSRIGYELGIPERAVRRHRARLCEKLGAANAPHAVAIWLGREALDRLIDESRRLS